LIAGLDPVLIYRPSRRSAQSVEGLQQLLRENYEFGIHR